MPQPNDTPSCAIELASAAVPPGANTPLAVLPLGSPLLYGHGSPVAPLSPFGPVAPTGPVAPWTPVSPCGPASPCTPLGPALPFNAVKALFDMSTFWSDP